MYRILDADFIVAIRNVALEVKAGVRALPDVAPDHPLVVALVDYQFGERQHAGLSDDDMRVVAALSRVAAGVSE